MKTIFAILILAGLASAQAHNVVLTWDASTSAANFPGLTYNGYKAPGTCPAAGTDPKTVSPPFSLFASGLTSTSVTDVGAISPGQTWCYYVTAVSGFIVNPGTGTVTSNESGPSNYAQPTLQATGTPPPSAPMNAKAILQ